MGFSWFCCCLQKAWAQISETQVIQMVGRMTNVFHMVNGQEDLDEASSSEEFLLCSTWTVLVVVVEDLLLGVFLRPQPG